MSNAASTPTGASSPEPTRRDFLYIATAAMGAVGVAATLVPLIDQMKPDARPLLPAARSTSISAKSRRANRSWCAGGIDRSSWSIAHRKFAGAQDPRFGRAVRSAIAAIPATALCSELAPLGKARVRGSRRHLHASRLHPGLRSPAECDRTGRELVGRLFLSLPWLEIRSGRPGISECSRALQFAGSAISFRQRHDDSDRRKSARCRF